MHTLFVIAVLLNAALVYTEEKDMSVEEVVDLLTKHGFEEDQIEEISAGDKAFRERTEEEDLSGVSWRAASGYSDCIDTAEKGDVKPKPAEDICKTIECPEIEILPSGCGYAARKILAGRWVGTDMELDPTQTTGVSEDETTAAFMRLFRYISGSNDRGLAIDMTVPVINKWYWETRSPYALTRASMHFYVPKDVAANAPTPLDDGIYLEDWIDTVVYSRAFGGNDRSKYTYENEFHKLIWAIGMDDKDFLTRLSITAGYTRQFYGSQRQEVMFIARDQPN